MKSWFFTGFEIAIFFVGGLSPLGADVVTDWNRTALQAIRTESTPPPLAARNLAIIHVAMFDAANAVERRFEPYLFQPNSPPGTSLESAVIGAASECLLRLYPSQSAIVNQTLSQTLGVIEAGSNRDDGVTLGRLVAILTLAWRGDDGATTTVPYIPGAAPGNWRRTPPFFRPPDLPHWPNVMPFVMTNGSQFRAGGPPDLTGVGYAEDFLLTKELGGIDSVRRTEEQTLIARFWSDFSFTSTPPGHWNQIAHSIATNRTNSVLRNARLFALLNLAMADAGIACWDTKYAYNFWRPVTAIRAADTDGNELTEPDVEWTPLLTTPPFPEYVSGHSTFSAAAAAVLAEFFGTDRIQFAVGSDSMPGVIRTYENLTEVVEEIGMSRIYGGIHFLSADLDGIEMGRNLGEYVMRTALLPNTSPGLIRILAGAETSRFVAEVQGARGVAYVIQRSNDLMTWRSLMTNLVPFQLDISIDSSYQFFRAAPMP